MDHFLVQTLHRLMKMQSDSYLVLLSTRGPPQVVGLNERAFRRVHLSSVRTPQVDSPIGLDLKLAKLPPEDTLKPTCSPAIPRGSSGVL